MDDSQTNSKTPFNKSDRYLLLFLIAALLLVHAILNMLFGQTNINRAKNNINNNLSYVLNEEAIDNLNCYPKYFNSIRNKRISIHNAGDASLRQGLDSASPAYAKYE